MEDYTYHLHPDGHHVLGAHMLEICESIADGKPGSEQSLLPARQRSQCRQAGAGLSISGMSSMIPWPG